jgi:hypothetical protein
MEKEEVGSVLKEIAKNANSDLIQFFLITAVVAIAIAIPLYIAISKAQEKKREHYFEREEMIVAALKENTETNNKREELLINVVRENTQVNAGLRAILDNNNSHCDLCKMQQLSKFKIIEDKQSSTNDKLTEIITILNERKD